MRVTEPSGASRARPTGIAPTFVTTAKSLLLRRRTFEAINLLRRGLSLDPDNYDGALLLCKSLVAAKRLREARSALDRLLERHEDAQGYALLVRVCLVLENAVAAFDVAEQGCERFPDDERLTSLWVQAKQVLEGEIPLGDDAEDLPTDHDGTPAAIIAARESSAKLGDGGVVSGTIGARAKRRVGTIPDTAHYGPDELAEELSSDGEAMAEAAAAETSRDDASSEAITAPDAGAPARAAASASASAEAEQTQQHVDAPTVPVAAAPDLARAIQRFAATNGKAPSLFSALLGDGPPILRGPDEGSTVRSQAPTFDVGDVDDDEDDDPSLDRAFDAVARQLESEEDAIDRAFDRVQRFDSDSAPHVARGQASAHDLPHDDQGRVMIVSKLASAADEARVIGEDDDLDDLDDLDELCAGALPSEAESIAADDSAEDAAALAVADVADQADARDSLDSLDALGILDDLDDDDDGLDELSLALDDRSISPSDVSVPMSPSAQVADRAEAGEAPLSKLSSLDALAQAFMPSGVDDKPTARLESASLIDAMSEAGASAAAAGDDDALHDPADDGSDAVTAKRPHLRLLPPVQIPPALVNVPAPIDDDALPEPPLDFDDSMDYSASGLDAVTPSVAEHGPGAEERVAEAFDNALLEAPTPSVDDAERQAKRRAPTFEMRRSQTAEQVSASNPMTPREAEETPTPELVGAARRVAALDEARRSSEEVPLPAPEANDLRKDRPRIVHPMPPASTEVSLPRVDLATIRPPGSHDVEELSSPILEVRRPAASLDALTPPISHTSPDELAARRSPTADVLPAASITSAAQALADAAMPPPLPPHTPSPVPLRAEFFGRDEAFLEDSTPATPQVGGASSATEPARRPAPTPSEIAQPSLPDERVELDPHALGRAQRRRDPTIEGRRRAVAAEMAAHAVVAPEAPSMAHARAGIEPAAAVAGPLVIEQPPIRITPLADARSHMREGEAQFPSLDDSRVIHPMPTTPLRPRRRRESSPRLRTQRSMLRRLWPLWLALALMTLSGGVVAGLVVRKRNEAQRTLQDARGLARRVQAWMLRAALYKAKSAANLGGRKAGVVALAAAIHAQLAVDYADSDLGGAASLIDEAKRLGAPYKKGAARDLAIAEAYLALGTRPLPEAITRLSKSVAEHPGSARLRALHARALLANRELSLASRTLGGLPQNDPMVLRTLAELQWTMGHHSSARATLDAAVKAGVSLQQADLDLARLQLDASKLPASAGTQSRVARLIEAKLLSPAEKGWAHLLLADVAFRRGKGALAERQLRAALAVRPAADAAYYYHLARLLRSRSRYKDALSQLRRARRIVPRDARFIALEADLELCMDRPARAAALLRSLDELTPHTREVLLRAYLRRGDLRRARAELRKLERGTLRRVLAARIEVAAAKPYQALRGLSGLRGEPEVELVRALASMRAGELRAAERSLSIVLRSGVFADEAHWALSRVALRRNKGDKALTELRAAVAANSFCTRYRRALGKLLLRLGRHEKARAAFSVLLDRDGHDLGALAGRARASVELDSGQAEADLRALGKAGHRNMKLLLSARRAMRAGNWDNAELLMAQADPKWIEASRDGQLWMAEIHRRQRRPRLAEKAFRARLSDVASRPAAYLGLSRVALDVRDRPEAIKQAKAGVVALKDGLFTRQLTIALHVQLARIYKGRRRTSGAAIAELQEALTIDKRSHTAALMLGKLYRRLGKRRRAIPLLASALKNARNPRQVGAAKRALGRACRRLKDAPTACR